ncbi:hypothetical protein BH11PLA1_BH11PLA1_11780 [soil metagenome]
MNSSPLYKFLAELIGTFALVFAGCGAICANQLEGGAVGHVGIALTFGLVIMAMIYAFGDISGAHFNPAVTIGFVAARKMALDRAALYIAAQVLGAVAAAGLLYVLLMPPAPGVLGLGVNMPAANVLEWKAVVLEIVMTFFLMLVIFAVSSGSKEKGLMAGIAIGGVITLDILFGGTLSGASLNPARSIGPALVMMRFEHLWIYIVGPIAGALAAVPLAGMFQMPVPSSGGQGAVAKV